jgi:hypothetical protein
MSVNVSIRQHLGKHKIVCSVPYRQLDFALGKKKAVMPKKKVTAARNLKRLDQIYHSNQ